MNLVDEFPLRSDIAYLNHAAVSPWPRRTADAVKAFAEENSLQGSLDYPRWLVTEHELRARLQQLLNAPSEDDIALVKNTSEALSFVAYGLPWRPGDNVVTSDQEFPSNRIVWESLADQGVELRQADLSQHDNPEDSIFALCDENTRLIAISSVQYGTGLRMDLEALGDFCRRRDILFCVDAIQSIGAIRTDVQSIHADFVAADGHKWMLGPEGLGVFYSRPEARAKLHLTQFGWHMVEKVGEFDQLQWDPARSARRFECGSPNMLGIHALNASLSLLLDVGMGEVEERVLSNTLYITEGLQDNPLIELISPSHKDRLAGIVTFRHREVPNEELFAHLQSKGIFCAARAGGIRVSPHFYTPRSALDLLLESL